jgi:alpha-1,2-mannosyltransferase
LHFMLDKVRQFLTPAHIRFLLAGYLIGHVLGFLILVPTGGPLDRLGRFAGGDFMQFYITGKIVADGQADRLYEPEHMLDEQTHFRSVQEDITPITESAPRKYPLYPPSLALLFAPLGLLPYPLALALWCLLMILGYYWAGKLLLNWRDPQRPLRTADAWLGLAAFHPTIQSFWGGQLTVVWFLVLLGACRIHQQGRNWQAGLLLSVLGLKPQLAVCVGFWLLLRRDWPALAAFALGGIAQLATAALALGPAIWLEYLQAARNFAAIDRLHDFSGDFQQSIQGILVNIGGIHGRAIGLVLQALSALTAVLLLARIIYRRNGAAPDSWRRQYSGLVLFMMLSLPHLLIYDLVLLLLPIAFLLGRDNRAAVLLYASAEISQLYNLTGFSVVPLFSFWAMVCLAFGGAKPQEAVTR